MNDKQLEDFELWFDAQPDYCSYTRVRNFLTSYLNCSNGEAEVAMARLKNNDEIKIIAKKAGNAGRRVFKTPLDPLTEADIRAVWNGSASVTKDLNQIAVVVHDRTGHDVTDVKEFMRNLDNAEVYDSSFAWLPQDDHTEEEYLK